MRSMHWWDVRVVSVAAGIVLDEPVAAWDAPGAMLTGLAMLAGQADDRAQLAAQGASELQVFATRRAAPPAADAYNRRG